MTTFIVATRNRHKTEEIRQILGPQFHYFSLVDFPDAPAVKEDQLTFAGNAAKKAVELAQWLSASASIPAGRVLVLADDSGLEVDALHGAPGVYSARFAALDGAGEGNSSDADNNAKLLRCLQNVPRDQRVARFRCVLALVETGSRDYSTKVELFDGTCEGHINFSAQGEGGFGYDPLFVPEGFEKSFAQLAEGEKNQISHRARALAKLSARMAQGE